MEIIVSIDIVDHFQVEDKDRILLQHIAQYHASRQRNFLMLLTTHTNSENNRCHARIHDNTQCTRKYKDSDTQLCGSHINSLPYGRIDDQTNINVKYAEKKNKGRRSKNKNNINIEEIDLANYIKTELVTIDNTEYLIDDNNIIFENSDINTIVGRKISDSQYEWF